MAYLPTFHAGASQFSGSDRVLIARSPSCLFLALLLICNVSVCSVCSQQTNMKLRLMPHHLYEHGYEAPVLKRTPLLWAEMFLVRSVFKVKYYNFHEDVSAPNPSVLPSRCCIPSKGHTQIVFLVAFCYLLQ